MSGTPPRPEPLRVPVDDVAQRASLVAPPPDAPRADSTSGPVVVVRRAVRFVSDLPPRPAAAAAAAEFTPAPASPAVPARLNSAPPPIPPELRNVAIAAAGGQAPAEEDESLELSHEVAIDAAGQDLSRSDEVSVDMVDSAELPAAEAVTEEGAAEGRTSDVEISVSFEEDDDDVGFEDDVRLEDEDGLVARAYQEIEDEVSELPVMEELEEAGVGPGATGASPPAVGALPPAAGASPPRARSLGPPPPPPASSVKIALADPPDLTTLTHTARVAEARPSKPRPHPWWEILFDDDYLRTVRPPMYAQIARQCDFISRRLALKPGATVLDVGCGLGQQIVELTARGCLGVGLDLSLAMLSRASEEAQARGTKVNLLHADMRDMNFDGAFDAAMCLGTTFGYFDDESNRRVLERLFRALKPNGLLLLDVVNRDHVIRSQPNLIWFEGDGCVCMEESEFNFFTSRLHIKRTVIFDQGKQRENEYSLRLYALHELGQLLHSQGFRVTEVSGREALPGVFFGNESPNMLIVAEKRAHDGTGKYPQLADL